jgi:hypothetical protein
MTIRDTDLPNPLTKAWKLALAKKRYHVVETPPEPPTLDDVDDDDDDDDRTYPAMVVEGELSRMPED